MSVEFSKKHMLVGYRMRDWTKVYYYRDIIGTNSPGNPEIVLFHSIYATSRSNSDPVFGEVCWLPHFDPANFEAKTGPEKKTMHAWFLYRCYQYLFADVPSVLKLNQFDRVDNLRWQTWKLAADRKKRRFLHWNNTPDDDDQYPSPPAEDREQGSDEESSGGEYDESDGSDGSEDESEGDSRPDNKCQFKKTATSSRLMRPPPASPLLARAINPNTSAARTRPLVNFSKGNGHLEKRNIRPLLTQAKDDQALGGGGSSPPFSQSIEMSGGRSDLCAETRKRSRLDPRAASVPGADPKAKKARSMSFPLTNHHVRAQNGDQDEEVALAKALRASVGPQDDGILAQNGHQDECTALATALRQSKDSYYSQVHIPGRSAQ